MKEKTTFRIGELAKLFDIGVDSIRYYEEVGILRPKRDPINNYRLYTIEDVRKLTMIRELLGLNLTTEQIRDFDANRNIHNTISSVDSDRRMVRNELFLYAGIKMPDGISDCDHSQYFDRYFKSVDL